MASQQQRAGNPATGARPGAGTTAAAGGASNAIAGQSGAASSTTNPAASTSYKPLNVKDALSYLDQVKNQFNRRPEIYNRFLDIMKDFKTQQIDTPGVIDRVSSLFRGHPSLIQGFNTFLPPGYRIDCSFEPGQDGVITVTTPHGVTRRDGSTTTSTSAAISAANRASAATAAANAVGANKPKPASGAPGQSTKANTVSNQIAATAAAVRQQQQQQAQAAQRERERQAQAAVLANQQRNITALHRQNNASASAQAQASASAAAATASSSAAAAAAAKATAAKQPTPPVPAPTQTAVQNASTAAGAGMAGLHAAAGAVTNGQAANLTNAAAQRSGLAGQAVDSTRTSSATPALASRAAVDTKPIINRNARETSAPDVKATATTTNSESQTGVATTPSSTAAGADKSGANGSAQTRRPAEFNHAINFVNKIKNRFHKKPETYKAFLEILQTYQKEQRPIQAVYSQVTTLFKEAPDLLDEFKEFLPDTSAPSPKPAPPAAVKAGTPATQALPPTSTAAAASAAGAAGSRTGRNSSTTSLFGVNASGTSQPQPNQATSYLSSAKDRKGQVLPTASLDATANRRAGVPASLPVSAAAGGQNAAQQQSVKQIQAEKAQQVPFDKQEDPYDGDWQSVQPTSARKRRAAATAAEKNRKKSRTTATEESADEYQPNSFGAQQQVPASVVRGYPSGSAAPSAAGGYQVPPASASIPPPVQPIILPHALRPHGPRNQLQHLVNVDELALFDRVKKFLDDKAMYHEFLKLLNLYTQEIIDMPTLLEKAFLFIGSSDELFGLFREFVGEQDGFVEGEEWPIDNAPALERERVELYSLKSYGPSYRRLPYSESKGLACSGRDALCWSVLNDDWVAYATWASEGSGAHRKNPYEDALASSEQERHWYDYMIESNTRSIAALEPIVARIGLMSMEERSSFRLKPGLGGQSCSFYERIIKKIYGRDYGQEAIQALYDSPSVAAPIILNRMKQKDDEWKRALREWNRVWREVDAKNYYRSLDHQGTTFKTNDKKVTTSKNLVQEIETLRREQQQKRVSLTWDPATTLPLRPQHQFELQIDDFSVLFDVLKLAFSFLDRAVTPYNVKERAAIEETLRKMIPLIFSIDEKKVEANLAPAIQFDGDQEVPEAQESEDDANMSDTAASASDSSAPTSRKGAKRTAADLRKKLLTTTANGHIAKTAERADEALPEDASDDSPVMPSLEKGTWIAASPQPWPSLPPSIPRTPRSPSKFKSIPHPSPVAQQPRAQKEQEATSLREPRYNFFAGQSFYCFFRLFHMLYHRLATLKHEAQQIFEKQGNTTRLNPFAVDLGLAVPIPSVDDPHTPRGKNYYDYMLELCEKYFELEIDSQTFEENLRYMWGIKAFPAFTIDKVIASMVKHVHGINQDPRCHQLLDLLKMERSQDRTSVRQQIIYRHACEDVIGVDEKLFRFEWIPSSQVLTMQLMSPEDLTLDDALDSVTGGWNYYVDSYVLEQPTEGIGSEIHAPLLHRNRGLLEAKAPIVSGASDLAIRLAPDNFKLSYVKDTEETIYKVLSTDTSADEEIRSKRKDAWQRWLKAQDEEQVMEAQQVPDAHAAAGPANGNDAMDTSS